MNFTVCPSCGRDTFVQRNEHYGQCFSVRCGLRQVNQGAFEPAATIFEDLYRASHLDLMTDDRRGVRKAIAGVHPGVLAHSMIGCISDDVSVTDVCAPFVARAHDRLQSAESSLTQGRPTKAQQADIVTARRNYEQLKH